MALFRLYFFQSICVLLYLFFERNYFLIGNVDVYAGLIGAHTEVFVPHTAVTPDTFQEGWQPPRVTPDPFQEGWQPPRGVQYNDTYYLDLLKSEWCPGIGSCKNPNVILNNTGCCLPCSCSEDCWNIGNCCYDKQDSNSGTIMSRDICDFTGIIGTEHGSNMKQANSIEDFYMFIVSCNANYGTFEIATYKCWNPNLHNITEITPVYDPISGHNYKNMFCAICNYVTTRLERWLPKLMNYNVQPHSINILQNKENIFEDIHLPLGVSIIWTPQNINYTTCVTAVQPYFVSSCQIPMLETELLSNLCQSITMPVKYNGYIYKNIYCSFCSVFNFQNCRKDPIESYGGHSFSMFLNYDLQAARNYATSKPIAKCYPDFTYIDDLDECLKIHCGSSLIKLYGQCIAVMDNIIGTTLHFRIQIVFLASLLSQSKLDGIIGFTNTLIATNEFELTEKNVCFQMNSSVLDNHTVFDIKAAVELGKYTLSVQNYYTTFITKIHATKTNPSRSSLQEFGIIDVSQGDYGFHTLDLEYANYATFTERTGWCGYGVAMTNLQFCNSVRIKPFVYAYNNQINITFSGNNVTFKWSEYLIRHDRDGNVAQICVDTYVSRVSPYVIHQPSSVSSIRETTTLALILLLFVHLALSIQLIEVSG